jgi:hypothetical protein
MTLSSLSEIPIILDAELVQACHVISFLFHAYECRWSLVRALSK